MRSLTRTTSGIDCSHHEEHEDMPNIVGGAHSNAHSTPLSSSAFRTTAQGNINVEAVSPLICFVETDAQEERNDAGPDLWFI